MEEYPRPEDQLPPAVAPPAGNKTNMNLVLGAIMVWAIVGSVAIAALTKRSVPAAKPATAQVGYPTEIAWAGSFEEAMQRSKTEHKPVMVDFYTSWCGACKWLDANTYKEPAVIAETGGWIVVRVDAEQRDDVARQYGISAYPTLAFLRGDGQPLDYIVGAPDANELLTRMREAQSKFSS